MSVSNTAWAWTVPDLSATQRLVLLFLADKANTHSNAWPSTRTIQRATGLGRSAVFRALGELQELRLIAKIGEGGRWGNQAVYRVCGKWIKAQGFYVYRWHGDHQDAGDWYRVGLELPGNAHTEGPPTVVSLHRDLQPHPVHQVDGGGPLRGRGGST